MEDASVTDEMVQQAISSLPIVGGLLNKPETCPSVYELLKGEIPIDVDNFFKWRTSPEEHSMPHFSNEELCRKYGIVQKLTWTYFLKQTRPFRAFFEIQSDNVSKEIKANYPYVIHSIAMEDPWNIALCNSCVALTEMLGFDSHPLRTTLAALDVIAAYKNRSELETDCRRLLTDEKAARKLKDHLEDAMLQRSLRDEASTLTRWSLVMEFCRLYGLELPVKFLRHCAENNNWFSYILFAQIHNYPLDICLDNIQYFTRAALRTHLKLIFNLDPKAAKKFLDEGVVPEKPVLKSSPDFFGLVYKASLDSEVRKGLLASALEKESLELTVMAAVLNNEKILDCLCIYILLNLKDKPDSGTNFEEINVETLTSLLYAALTSRQFSMVMEAFQIFVPEHLLTYLLQWLDHFCRDKRDDTYLDKFQNALSDFCDSTHFFKSPSHVIAVGVHIVNLTLCHVIRNVYKQIELVNILASDQRWNVLYSDDNVPDFQLIHNLMSLAVSGGVQVELCNLLQSHSSLKFRIECQRTVEMLLERSHFETALQFAALADLPADSVFISQLATEFECQQQKPEMQTLRSRIAFWNRCNKLLSCHNVKAEITSGFFQDHLSKTLSEREAFVVVQHALRWKKLIQPPPTEELIELEILLWTHRIQAQIQESTAADGIAVEVEELRTSCSLLKPKTINVAGISNYPHPTKELTPEFLDEANRVINQYLDKEVIVEPLKLSAMFGITNENLLLLLVAMDVAEDTTSLSEANIQLNKMNQSNIEAKDRQSFIDQLADILQHGRPICQKISVYFAVSSMLDLKYDYLVEHPKPVCVLKMLLQNRNPSGSMLGISGNLNLARNWISAAGISQSEVVELLKDELVEVARDAYSESNERENTLLVSLLHGQFNRLVSLSSEPCLLGRRLLETAFQCEQSNEMDIAVELIIFAHSSFTFACDVENIGRVLSHTRTLIDKLQKHQQWSQITRLLTGIQRYTEMNYVFSLLKDNDQFEYLLRKGMDRLPLLRVALLDFLRRNCVGDRELFRLVALHFHMHSEVAEMWQEEADTYLNSLIEATQKSVGTLVKSPKRMSTSASPKLDLTDSIKTPTSWKSVAEPTTPVFCIIPTLKSTPELKQGLLSAMHNLAHATEYYMQAGKLNHARKCAVQAELVALQCYLLERVDVNGQGHCILGLSAAQVNQIIVDHLSYPEAEIVWRAYGYGITWGRVLMRRYIINNETDYLEQFTYQHPITVALVEETVAYLELEQGKKLDYSEKLAHLVSMLTDLEAKYRIASRLGLRKLVRELLSSSGLPYLKDTAWKTANQD